MKGTATTGQGVWERGSTPLRRAALYSFASLVFGFLILPTLVVIPLSVTESPYLQFPPKGFTWQWYQDYFGVVGATQIGTGGRWISATLISLELALMVVAVAVPIGALAAYGLSRGTYRGKSVLNAIIISPLVMPILVTAIALFFFLSKSLRSFFQPLPLPSVPVWGEWIILGLALLLGTAAIVTVILPGLYRRPMTGVVQTVHERARPWAPLALVITLSFFFVTWAAGASDALPGGLFSPDDPIPPVPMVSPGLLVSHIVLAIPYVVIILTATLRGVDRTLDQAAAILGAGPFTTLRRVVLPCMAPGLAAAAFFCFIVSWDELLIALFLSNSEVSTLPKEIWDGIRTTITPTLAAISTLLIVLTMALLGLALVVQARLRRARGLDGLIATDVGLGDKAGKEESDVGLENHLR